ncbi:hypothetical protein Mal15_61220 [Stieleria maiorica]|uniref:Uncharacterized protein n=1 Tax=Stieleria maiorica TaxID=2795974 RepID=A0A5B9ML83_9BACT|nr:hypothetical protein Mal15_61220 [Stieleria maiorica]
MPERPNVNPYKPTRLIGSQRTSFLRLIVCLIGILITAVAFLYFAAVSLLYCWMLFVPMPGWPVSQLMFNIVIWTAFATLSAFGFWRTFRALASSSRIDPGLDGMRSD